MKWLVLLVLGAVGYYAALTASTELVFDQLDQIKVYYESADVIAERIAAGDTDYMP